jgi:hypothetical protein
MTLSRSSVLLYWSSRYGLLPILGGKPTFARNSAGSVADARGELYDAIINTPRFSWETDRSTPAAEKRAMLLLEAARQNTLGYTTDFSNAVWVKTSVTVATGVLDPKGGTSACTLTATAAAGTVYQHLAAGSSLQRSNALWLRRRTGAGAVNLLLSDGSAYSYAATGLSAVWQRFQVPAAAASTARWIGLSIATSGDAVDVYNGQQEDALVSSSDIVNLAAGAGTRAVDTCSWSFLPTPQGMMVFSRHVEGGSAALGAGVIWASCSAAGAAPYLFVHTPGAGVYRVVHTGTGAGVSASLAAGPAAGDTVDLLAVLNPNGSVELYQSINGAAVTSTTSGGSETLAAAWSGPALWLNSLGSGAAVGFNRFADLRAVKYADVVAATAQGRMDELRSLELGPNGDLL